MTIDDAKGHERGLREELYSLYINGPVWDGDVISKAQRDELVKRGWCIRANGYNVISDEGIKALRGNS